MTVETILFLLYQLIKFSSLEGTHGILSIILFKSTVRAWLEVLEVLCHWVAVKTSPSALEGFVFLRER